MNKRFCAQVVKYLRILTLKLFAEQIIKNLWPKVITKKVSLQAQANLKIYNGVFNAYKCLHKQSYVLHFKNFSNENGEYRFF